jgi:hypothetical protein
MPKKVRDDEEPSLREAICLVKKAGSFKAAKKALEKVENIYNLLLSAGFSKKSVEEFINLEFINSTEPPNHK